jgi:hypothetical protein
VGTYTHPVNSIDTLLTKIATEFQSGKDLQVKDERDKIELAKPSKKR